MGNAGKIEPVPPGHPSPKRDFLWIASIALIYFALARLSLLLVFKPEGIAAIWPLSGVFLSAILLTRRDLRPWLTGTLLIVDFIAERMTGTSWLVSFIYSVILTGDAIFSSWLLLRIFGEPITFKRASELFTWLLLSVGFSNAISSIIAAWTTSYLVPGSHFWTSYQLWIMSAGVGNLIFTPFILGWAARRKVWGKIRNPNFVMEGTVLISLLAILNIIAFERLSENVLFALLLTYLTFPFLIWAALRFGIHGVATACLIVASIAVYFASTGHIEFSIKTSQLNTVLLVQVYLAIMAVPALFLAVVVTERHLVESALRDSEEKFKYIFDYSNIGKSITLISGKSQVNKNLSEMLGYSPEELQDNKLLEITHPDDIELSKREMNTLLSGDKNSTRFIKRFIKKDGSILWVDLSSMLRRDKDGAPLYFITSMVDITERKQMEEVISESSDRFRAIFEQAGVGVAQLDTRTGKYIQANRKYCEIVGLDPDEIQNHDFMDITHPDDVKENRDKLDQMLAGEIRSFSIDKRYIHNDGELVWATLTVSPMWKPDEQPKYHIAVIVDITERKKIEKALQDSERGLAEAQNLASIGSWEYDVATDKTTWSKMMFNLFGRDPNLPSPSWQEHRNSIYPEDWDLLDQAVASGEPYNIEFRLIHPTKGIRWAQTICKNEIDDSGKIVKLKGTVQDITERKKFEEEIQLLNQTLETKVEERTVQLADANKELESFSYSVSHDLRTPLRALDGFSLALLEDYDSILDSTGKHYLNRIRGASQKMAQLIDALLGLSRVTKTEIKRTPVNLTDIAKNIAAGLDLQNPGRKVTWKIDPHMNTLADQPLISSVMENLLNNAWKFTAKHPHSLIEVGKLAQGDNDVFYVKDDGAGFDMKFASKMFGPFQRFHSNSEFEGTGIGLATVSRIIKKHGGRIWSESEPEKGATFYFTLG